MISARGWIWIGGAAFSAVWLVGAWQALKWGVGMMMPFLIWIDNVGR